MNKDKKEGVRISLLQHHYQKPSSIPYIYIYIYIYYQNLKAHSNKQEKTLQLERPKYSKLFQIIWKELH